MFVGPGDAIRRRVGPPVPGRPPPDGVGGAALPRPKDRARQRPLSGAITESRGGIKNEPMRRPRSSSTTGRRPANWHNRPGRSPPATPRRSSRPPASPPSSPGRSSSRPSSPTPTPARTTCTPCGGSSPGSRSAASSCPGSPPATSASTSRAWSWPSRPRSSTWPPCGGSSTDWSTATPASSTRPPPSSPSGTRSSRARRPRSAPTRPGRS